MAVWGQGTARVGYRQPQTKQPAVIASTYPACPAVVQWAKGAALFVPGFAG